MAANILLGQIPDLCGAPSEGQIALTRALNVLAHPSEINMPSLLAGLGAIAIIVALARTRLASIGSLFALVIPSVAVLGISSVQRVSDAGAIPSGLPVPDLPDLGALSLNVVIGALAVAGIVLVYRGPA